jgi:hypothetical protein
MPGGSMSDSYPFLFWSGRILFAVGILIIGMALAGCSWPKLALGSYTSGVNAETLRYSGILKRRCSPGDDANLLRRRAVSFR